MPQGQGFAGIPPGPLSAYLGVKRANEAAGLAELQKVGAVQGLLASMQKQQQEQKFREEMQALGPQPEQAALSQVAAKYASPGQVLTSQTASLDRKAQREQRLWEIAQAEARGIREIRQRAAEGRITREEADMREARLRKDMIRLTASLRPPRETPLPEQAVTRLMETGLSRETAINIVHGRYAVSRDPISGAAQIVDKATGKLVQSQPSPSPELAPTPVPAAAPSKPPVTGISPSVRGAQGTGPRGFYGNIANVVVGAMGGGAPLPEVEQAIQALTNLRVQTNLSMQAAVPGRPSVYLMEQLDKLAVAPASLLQADDRAEMRLHQTRDMLRTEIQRMERDILANPSQFQPEQITATRVNRSQLQGLLREYDTIIENFKRPAVAAPLTEGARERSRSGKPIIFRNGRWEYE